MALVDLDTLKRHLRIFHDDEDADIEIYGAAAESIVVEYLDRVVLPSGETLPDDDEYAIHVSPAITAAILLVVGDLFEVREPDPKLTGDAVLPRSVRMLLAPRRVWRTPEVDHVGEVYCRF